MGRESNRVKLFSALEAADLCGVVHQTAINWIKKGYLKSSRTPGGQYRIYPRDLADFLAKQDMVIPDTLLALITPHNVKTE